jgi:hypothetical protein
MIGLSYAVLYALPLYPAIMFGVVYAAEHPRPRIGDLRLRRGRLQRYDWHGRHGWTTVPAKPVPTWDDMTSTGEHRHV